MQEYPKWVKIDGSLVEHQNGVPVVPTFEHCHVDRVTKDVTVLAHDKADEDRARAGKAKPAPAAAVITPVVPKVETKGGAA